jgi:hypothetical protein
VSGFGDGQHDGVLASLPGPPFFERGKQGVPDQVVEVCVVRVILSGCGEQDVERRRACR